LYRAPIYKLIDQTFDTQFIFADSKMDIAKMDISVFKKPVKYVHAYKIKSIEVYRGVWKLAFSKFDTFLITSSHPLGVVPLIIISHILGKKVYGWGHGAKKFGGRFAVFYKWFIKQWDGFFTYGEGGKKRLIELGMNPAKIHVIYNSLNEGVNENNCNYSSTIFQTHFGNDNPTIIFVGRLTAVKKLDWLLSALEKHSAKGVNYNLILIGDGEEMDNLVKTAERLDLSSKVWFYGECYDDEKLNELIYNADLCVSPGNVGLTALNAMRFGTPVLSHNDFETQMPEYETISPGFTGDLYQKDNFYDFCHKIEKWISASYDRDVIRKNCYNMINGKWNARNQIEILINVLGK
jgi:glycosyltransferase involved in cell wall biosynthesis